MHIRVKKYPSIWYLCFLPYGSKNTILVNSFLKNHFILFSLPLYGYEVLIRPIFDASSPRARQTARS